MITTTHSHKHWTDKGGHVKGGEPSAPATPGLIPPSYTTCWDAAELIRLTILQLIPRNELSQFDQAIVTREFVAKRQEEVFQRELMTMLKPVHVENSGPLLGSDQPVHAYFTVRNY
jgi:hypothetical protein